MKKYGSPLLGFFHNGRLTAITVGVINYETLDQALMVNEEDVKIFTAHKVYSLSDERVQLEKLFLANEKTKIDTPNLVFTTMLLGTTGTLILILVALFRRIKRKG